MDEAKLVVEQCRALLTAGLAREAVDLVRSRVDAGSVPAAEVAKLVLVRAGAELGRRRPRRLTAQRDGGPDPDPPQGRDRDALDAEARGAACEVPERLPGSGDGVLGLVEAEQAGLEAARSDDAAAAWLLAGRTALDLGSAAAPGLAGAGVPVPSAPYGTGPGNRLAPERPGP